jgi:hypothetical protein
MKKQILTILTCLASITAFSQTTEIKLSFDNFTPITVSRESGEMLFGDQIYTKSTAKITDSLVTVVDSIGKKTNYRVLRNYTGFDSINSSEIFTISLFVINDSTNNFWNIDLFKLDATSTSIGFSIYDMEKTFRYNGDIAEIK